MAAQETVTRTAISPGVYEGPSGVFWSRPAVRGRRTWRKLRAVKAAAAVRENALADWQAPANTLAELAALYCDAGCPNKRLEPRPASFTTTEINRVTLLTEFFGNVPADSLRIADIPRYKVWRVRRLRFGTGDRTVDKDIQTLSNILNYGVAMGIIAFNYLRAGRPRYQRADRIRHAREVAPTDAGVIHRLADEFFTEIRSEVLGWQLLFAMFTGCRTSELLRLRVDAADVTAAGFRAGDRLFLGRRSKGGVNPWAMVGPEFGRMLECFDRWHAARHPGCPWYFPTPNGGHAPVNPGALGHALTRIGTQLRLPHITPHGLRSFYVTKRRSDGAADTVIAGEIGDKTVALMQTTYGARPENWTGGAALSWLPSVGLPAWDRWQSAAAKIVSL